ncbi:MAG: flavodoxin domain-containing protein [Bdellovibrionales bacterium]|jgi:menaquinone-dependent protoporphyrinogen oxidase
MNEPARFSLFYASRDGQAARVATFLAGHLTTMGHEAVAFDLGRDQPPVALWDDSTACFVIAPIRFGKHLPPVDDFIKRHKKTLNEQPLVLVSINLTARKKGKDTPEANPYLGRWVKKHGLRPFIATVFAGKLDYKLYSWWEKQAIRLIMKITGGPTNLDAAIDFTPWDKVESLAKRVALLAPPVQEEEVA